MYGPIPQHQQPATLLPSQRSRTVGGGISIKIRGTAQNEARDIPEIGRGRPHDEDEGTAEDPGGRARLPDGGVFDPRATERLLRSRESRSELEQRGGTAVDDGADRAEQDAGWADDDIVPSSREGERGGVVAGGWMGLRSRGVFLESPFLALQAHEVELRIGGVVHGCILPRQSCWWFSGGKKQDVHVVRS